MASSGVKRGDSQQLGQQQQQQHQQHQQHQGQQLGGDPLEAAIRQNTQWEQLPSNLKGQLGSSESAWQAQVVGYSIRHQLRWKANLVRHYYKDERKYYQELVKYSQDNFMLYPYHLSGILVKGLHITPFDYYIAILQEMLQGERSYDALPNFAAADCLRLVGIGRNQYIDTMNQSRVKGWSWKAIGAAAKRRQAIKQLLPAQPIPLNAQHWWIVHPGFYTEEDVRQLNQAERTMLEILVTTGHKMAGELDYNTLLGLHTRGLVFLEVPVDDHDRVAVPPLEGFVMNRVTGDYFETLLYKIFVTIDEHTTIADLAAVLQTDLESVKHAVSVYCRLGFAKKKNVELDVDDVRWHLSWISRVVHRRSGSTKAETQDVQPAASTKRVAFLFDSTLTAFLMMGNLSMGLKTHAVTMFEVGKLTEESMEKFLAELDRLEGELEGDAQRYFEHAIILRDTLLFLRYNPQLAAIVDPSAAELAASGAPARPIALDLLRCESISTLDPETCFRVLNKNYHMIVSMAPFAKEVRSIRGCVPQHIGPPIPEMGSVWFKLWLYGCAGSGPPTLLLPMGARLCELPALMQPFDRVLITTWDHEPTVSSLATMLPVVNDQLCGSPVLVQAYNEQTEIAYVPFPLGPEGESGSDLPAGSSARLAAALALIQKVTALAAKRGLLPLSQHPSVLALSKHIDLAHACGYISMLKLGNSSDTSIALDAETLPDGSELPASLTHIGFFHPAHATDWVVLDLAFGIPLFDAIINAEVCRRMAVHNLFAKDALQAQMQSNRQLALELLGFINRHIAGGLLPLLDATAATLYPTQIVTYPAHLADL